MKNVFIFIVAFVITLLLLEVYLQQSEVSALSVTKNDDILGITLKSDRRLIFFNEGFYIGGINQYGYYGEGYPPYKNDNTIRIALVGDSYVESHQLFDRYSFRKILEKNLQRNFKKQKIEVLNFGMSGFNLNDDYCYYVNFVKKFNPDFVLFFVSNEDFDSTSTSDRRPQCYLNNDSLKIDYSFNKKRNYIHRKKTAWFRGKSILMGWIYKAKLLIKTSYVCEIFFDKFCSKDYKWKQNSESKKDVHKISKVIKAIITKVKKSKNTYFVGKEPLSIVIKEYLQRERKNFISLANIDKKKYHFWKVSGKYGHWNFEGHKEVGRQLTDTLSIIIKNYLSQRKNIHN